MAIITLPDHNLTNSAARRSKVWFKALTGIDTSKSDGYAFQGTFANFGETVEVAEGAWLMSLIEDVRSSGRLDGRDVTLYQVRDGKLAEVESWSLGSERGWALLVRDQIAAHMAKPAEPATPDVDALLAEREALLARIAEIDALLPEPEGTEVDTRQAAQVLGVSIRTVQRWAAQGRVQATKSDSGHWVITITINA
ncbi:helix-turn-helix domain-containing protein [Dactylosporangium sp. NPDC000555]|uniref:helix-turn-helix domain-containing protein n=1 Tax=Dactylosporangium sp. NPDC000555 TaxID=3154260 RepID=UPI00331A9A6D